MKPLEAARYVAEELANKEKSKLVILSGSAARGKLNPNDLDIAAVFPYENNLLDQNYRSDLIRRLSSQTRYGIDLIDFNEKYIDRLIRLYNDDSRRLCGGLGLMTFKDMKNNQWKGWPLAWIFGKDAKEKLDPYLCFQEEMIVLSGQHYLIELRLKINKSTNFLC